MSLDFSLRIPATFEGFDDEYEGEPTHEEVFTKNITHNCSKMMRATHTLHSALYDSDGVEAKSIIVELSLGLLELATNQEEIKKLEPTNGWGSYEGLVDFTCEVLAACVKNPHAIIHVCA